MRYRITFAFQLWWYFNHETLLWHPFHEFHLKMYDKYAIKIEKKVIDPCEFITFKMNIYNSIWKNFFSDKGVSVPKPKFQFTEPPPCLQ